MIETCPQRGAIDVTDLDVCVFWGLGCYTQSNIMVFWPLPYQTKNNREVKDSRGVDPDIIVEQEYYSKLAETLIYNDHIFNFVNGYIKENQEIPSVEEFAFSDEEFSLFSNYLNGKNIDGYKTIRA